MGARLQFREVPALGELRFGFGQHSVFIEHAAEAVVLAAVPSDECRGSGKRAIGHCKIFRGHTRNKLPLSVKRHVAVGHGDRFGRVPTGEGVTFFLRSAHCIDSFTIIVSDNFKCILIAYIGDVVAVDSVYYSLNHICSAHDTHDGIL